MNAYEQQFDAFLKGQLNIDVVPDLRLSIMSNPYDESARRTEGFFIFGTERISTVSIIPISALRLYF